MCIKNICTYSPIAKHVLPFNFSILYLSNWIKEDRRWFWPGHHLRNQFDLPWWLLPNVWSCCYSSSAGYLLVWLVSVTDTPGVPGPPAPPPATMVHSRDTGETNSTEGWTCHTPIPNSTLHTAELSNMDVIAGDTELHQNSQPPLIHQKTSWGSGKTSDWKLWL